VRDQRLLREASADRGGKATILFADSEGGQKYEADFVVLKNGGVMHTDDDGWVRWHPPARIRMVIWKGEEDA
jgi:hypothetical protein